MKFKTHQDIFGINLSTSIQIHHSLVITPYTFIISPRNLHLSTILGNHETIENLVSPKTSISYVGCSKLYVMLPHCFPIVSQYCWLYITLNHNFSCFLNVEINKFPTISPPILHKQYHVPGYRKNTTTGMNHHFSNDSLPIFTGEIHQARGNSLHCLDDAELHAQALGQGDPGLVRLRWSCVAII